MGKNYEEHGVPDPSHKQSERGVARKPRNGSSVPLSGGNSSRNLGIDINVPLAWEHRLSVGPPMNALQSQN